MRTSVRWLLIASLAVVALLGAARAGAGPAYGTITGVVFDDLDGDGVHAEGEPGLPDKVLRLSQGEVTYRLARTAADGSYSLDSVLPGEYVLETMLHTGVTLCAEYPASFDPLVRSWCFRFTLPCHATPDPMLLTVEAGAVLQVDLGAQPADVAVVGGIALLEDGRAPPGTLIEALVDGQECGTTEVLDDDELNFELHILGGRERQGCALIGDDVHLRVGGVPVTETFAWAPFAYSTGFGLRMQNLVAMEDHAWYWMETFTRRGASGRLSVEAFVGDQLCGEGQLQLGKFKTGFSRLVVPSDAVQPGCAANGRLVEFRVGGLRAETAVTWRPGVQRLNLLVQGDADCDLDVTTLDALLALQVEAGLLASVPCHGDADRDGDIDVFDARHILEFVAGIFPALPL